MNGFKDAVWREQDKIETIELVLEDFGSMGIMNRFKGLKSLTLINCGIATIEVLFLRSRVLTMPFDSRDYGLTKTKSLRSKV